MYISDTSAPVKASRVPFMEFAKVVQPQQDSWFGDFYSLFT
jgi:hypothetical protein